MKCNKLKLLNWDIRSFQNWQLGSNKENIWKSTFNDDF